MSLFNRIKNLPLHYKVLYGVIGSYIGYQSIRSIQFRLIEKSKKFNAYTTSEEAINGIDLSGKCAIVTGCNTGIGYETVRVMAKQGACVGMKIY